MDEDALGVARLKVPLSVADAVGVDDGASVPVTVLEIPMDLVTLCVGFMENDGDADALDSVGVGLCVSVVDGEEENVCVGVDVGTAQSCGVFPDTAGCLIVYSVLRPWSAMTRTSSGYPTTATPDAYGPSAESLVACKRAPACDVP
eukprot:PhM_4_TR2851/c1_g1_i1/m.31449